MLRPFKTKAANRIYWAVIAAIVAVSMGVTFYSGTIDHAVETKITEKATNNLNFKQRLIVIEQELNQGTPKMIDAATRLDSVKVLYNTITYNYTLVNLDAPDHAMRKELKVTEHDRLKTLVMTDKQFDELRQGNTIIIFSYKDRNDKPYEKIVITPDDYHGNKKVEEINSNFE